MEKQKTYEVSLQITLLEEEHKELIKKLNKMVKFMHDKGFNDYTIENAMQVCLLIGCYHHIDNNVNLFVKE